VQALSDRAPKCTNRFAGIATQAFHSSDVSVYHFTQFVNGCQSATPRAETEEAPFVPGNFFTLQTRPPSSD
jgi:hypothetical protein